MNAGTPEAIAGTFAETQVILGADARVAGRVKFFDATKSYGYIVADAGDEYFFNTNSFRGEAPRKGVRVAFDPKQGPKGLIATRIQVAASA